MNIGSLFRKQGQMYYIFREIKKSFEKDHRWRMINVDSNPYQPIIHHYGGLNKGRIIYRIKMNEYTGFYAMLNHINCHLRYAQMMGFVPIIQIGERFPYYETGGVNGETNPWLYYFKAVSDIREEEVDKSYAVVEPVNMGLLDDEFVHCTKHRYIEYIRCHGYNGYLGYLGYRGYQGSGIIPELGEAYARYVKLNENSSKDILPIIEVLLGDKRTLGVKIRMGGMLYNCKAHPQVPTLDEFVQRTRECLEGGRYEQIFLATDDERATKRYKKEFGEKVIFYDIVRSEGLMDNYEVPSSRKNNRYYCGLEVIRDVYTLGKCEGMVAGLSQVSTGAMIYKASRGESYKDFIVLDNGMNLQGPSAATVRERYPLVNEIKKIYGTHEKEGK